VVAAVFHTLKPRDPSRASLFLAAGSSTTETGSRVYAVLRGGCAIVCRNYRNARDRPSASMAGVPLLNGILRRKCSLAETV